MPRFVNFFRVSLALILATGMWSNMALSLEDRAIAVSAAKVSSSIDMSFSSTTKRIALVIGNQDYRYISVLSNPRKDAQDMATALRLHGGFEVIEGIDLDHYQFRSKVQEFKDKLQRAGSNAAGLVYYAGHGFEFENTNYMLPVDLDISSGDKFEVSQSSISLNTILEAINPRAIKASVVILDACRNDPFNPDAYKFLNQDTNFSASTGGWAKIEKPGLYAAYGTLPGKTASDGRPGDNGIFTKHILAELEQPGQTLEEVFREVINKVTLETGRVQNPTTTGSVGKAFYLHPCDLSETCGDGQMYVIYGLVGVMVLLILSGVFYIRSLAIQNNTSMGQAFESATEGITEFIGGKKTPPRPAFKTDMNSDDEISHEPKVLGYLRHNRHNREIAHIKENEPLTIGREKSSGVNVVIADTKGHIARTQAKVGWDSHRRCFWIMDLGSKNGTYLSRDEKLKPHEIYYLNSGQTFFLASKYHPMTIVKNEG